MNQLELQILAGKQIVINLALLHCITIAGMAPQPHIHIRYLLMV
nr:MAG TPA: hypothetical protein [Caudoviricetes sp.]